MHIDANDETVSQTFCFKIGYPRVEPYHLYQQILFQMSKGQRIFRYRISISGQSNRRFLRGAGLGREEREYWNLKAERLIKSVGIYAEEKGNSFDVLRERFDFSGFAHYYLQKCWRNDDLANKADVDVYKQLLDIDAELGTSETEQLFQCVSWTFRIDLIQVWIQFERIELGLFTIFEYLPAF